MKYVRATITEYDSEIPKPIEYFQRQTIELETDLSISNVSEIEHDVSP